MNKQVPEPQNSWITESEKSLLESTFMSIHELTCRSSEDSRKMKFYTLRSRDWCNIIPVTADRKVVLIKQFRIGVGKHTIEIPGGVVDPTDPDVQATALRELEEETGYTPLAGARIETLGSSLANPAIQNNRVNALIVGPVRKQKKLKLDDGEMIETLEVPIEEIPALILNGTIDHALMLDTFFFLLMTKKSTTELLQQALLEFSNGTNNGS